MSDVQRIVVLSDTHGVLPPLVAEYLRCNDIIHILHAGDVGNEDIVKKLQMYAPTTWVRGNMDRRDIGNASEIVDINGVYFYLVHNIYDIDVDAGAAGIAAVIHGHLHVPSIEWKQGVLHMNPGSCAFPREGHAPSIGIIEIHEDQVLPSIIYQK